MSIIKFFKHLQSSSTKTDPKQLIKECGIHALVNWNAGLTSIGNQELYPRHLRHQPKSFEDRIFNPEHDKYHQQIGWIFDVDFIPESKDFYREWPHPFRQMAFSALKKRKQNFERMVEQKLSKFE